MNLTIDRGNALQAHKEADQGGRRLLEALFGKSVFAGKRIEYVGSFKDVCDEAGVDIENYEMPASGTKEQKAAAYRKRLRLIQNVFNEGCKPNIADTSQNKFYPWFKIVPDTDKPSGFGLSFHGRGYDYSVSSLGARPYFKDRETAEYVGRQFIRDYEGWAQNESF